MQNTYHESVNNIVETEVFGDATQWEKHEIGGGCTFVKAISSADAEMKARIAKRYDELGFVPAFFSERGKSFVALEAVKQAGCYKSVEEAFASQILGRNE